MSAPPATADRGKRSLISDLKNESRDMEPIIAGRDLRKAWGSTIVLEHADFTIHAGEKVALVGPNGAGKTTLLQLLMGEQQPDPGGVHERQGLRLGSRP